MGRVKETLWVEPRLRGMVVLHDDRNPAGAVGRFFSYETGWSAAVGLRNALPGGSQTPQLEGVRLRFTSAGAQQLAARAVERDLRRRLREGLIDCTLKSPRPWVCALPWVICGTVAALVLVGVMLLPGAAGSRCIVLGGLLLPFVLMTSGLARLTARTVRVHAFDLELRLNNGSTVRRPIAQVTGARPTLFGIELAIADGSRVRVYTDTPAGRTLKAALRAEFGRDDTRREKAAVRSIVLRTIAVYAPLAALAMGFAHWKLQLPTGFQIPGRPILSAAIAGAAIYVLCVLPMMRYPSERWLNRWTADVWWRRRRRRDRLRTQSQGAVA